jgi:hypothetical protein
MLLFSNVVYAVKHPEDETYYRAKLTSINRCKLGLADPIGSDHAVAHFIDYGDSASVPLSAIFVCPESVRDTPPMAIKCKLKLGVPSDFRLRLGPVRVPKAAADERETIEVVFGEEVDKVKLIRSLKTQKPAKDLPLTYDASYDEEEAIAEKLPPANTSFTRDEILSKDCTLAYSK